MWHPWATLAGWWTGYHTGRMPPLFRELAQNLHGGECSCKLRDPESRRRLFHWMRHRLETLPWHAIHPTWLLPLIRSWPAPWPAWVCAWVPESLRSFLMRAIPVDEASIPPPTSIPPFWKRWMVTYLRRRLGYPDPWPWERPTPDACMPGSLWVLDSTSLMDLLRLHGALGPTTWSRDPLWTVAFRELVTCASSSERLTCALALADWVRCAIHRCQVDSLRRLLLRLPRPIGILGIRWLHRPPPWTLLPVPDPEAWDIHMQSHLRRLDLIPHSMDGGKGPWPHG